MDEKQFSLTCMRRCLALFWIPQQGPCWSTHDCERNTRKWSYPHVNHPVSRLVSIRSRISFLWGKRRWNDAWRALSVYICQGCYKIYRTYSTHPPQRHYRKHQEIFHGSWNKELLGNFASWYTFLTFYNRKYYQNTQLLTRNITFIKEQTLIDHVCKDFSKMGE